MVKVKKSNPNSKRKGVKNESMPYNIELQSLKHHKPYGYAVKPGVETTNYDWNPRKGSTITGYPKFNHIRGCIVSFILYPRFRYGS